MSDLDLTKLREIAEAATEGPWKSSMVRVEPDADNALRGAGVIRDGIGSIVFMSANGPEILVSDAAHIATFDPPTVLALIDEVERLKARVEAAKAIHFDEGKSQGYFNNEPYGERDHCCNECGSVGEYGVEWPCPTVKALAGGSDE